jgi:hypothetical protein
MVKLIFLHIKELLCDVGRKKVLKNSSETFSSGKIKIREKKCSLS